MTSTSKPNTRHSITTGQIDACVGRLSGPQVAILRASLTDGYETIAKATHVKLGTVKSRLNRARTVLLGAIAENEKARRTAVIERATGANR